MYVYNIDTIYVKYKACILRHRYKHIINTEAPRSLLNRIKQRFRPLNIRCRVDNDFKRCQLSPPSSRHIETPVPLSFSVVLSRRPSIILSRH